MTSEVRLRVAGAHDAFEIAAIYGPVVERTTMSFETEAPDGAAIAARMADAADRWPWLVAADADGVAAYAYASQHRTRAAYRWSVDVSVYAAERARRRGLGSRLYRALFAILTAQGYYNAFAGITLPNAASTALHAALGFEPVGTYRNAGFKLGGWHDVAWCQRALRPPTAVVTEPLPLAAVAADVTAILASA